MYTLRFVQRKHNNIKHVSLHKSKVHIKYAMYLPTYIFVYAWLGRYTPQECSDRFLYIDMQPNNDRRFFVVLLLAFYTY